MIVEYRRPMPEDENCRAERRAWLGFAIWIPGMIIAAVLLGLLLDWMKSQ